MLSFQVKAQAVPVEPFVLGTTAKTAGIISFKADAEELQNFVEQVTLTV